MLLFVNFASINAEYQETVATFPLELAPGFTFPPTLVGNDELTEYGVGYGRMMAWLHWIAGVEAAACDAHADGNADEAHRLLFIARSWPDTDVYRACATGDLDYVAHLIDPALDGDFAPLTAWVRGSN